MLRSEPIFLTPPLTKSALVMVDKPLTVYEPGFSASPNTNTLMERKSPMPMLTRVPISCCETRCSIVAWA